MQKQTAEKKILTGEDSISRYALKRTGAAAKQYLISEDVARDQLMEMLGYYDIDISRVKENPEDVKSLERAFDQLVDYIRLGKIEIRHGAKEKLEVLHNLEGGETVVYGEIGSAAKLAMDKHKPDQRYARMYALMGSLSSLGSAGIQKFPAKDLAVVEVLGPVFMSA